MYAGSQSSDNISHNVRLLDETDRDMFIAVSSEPIKNRPPLSLLFDIFASLTTEIDFTDEEKEAFSFPLASTVKNLNPVLEEME